MNKQFTYKPGVLVEMAQEYLEAERSKCAEYEREEVHRPAGD